MVRRRISVTNRRCVTREFAFSIDYETGTGSMLDLFVDRLSLVVGEYTAV